jgi:hypothetical protein
MPQLYVFAVCEKVIIDQNGIPSLISLFTRVNFSPATDIPGNAIAPKEWSIYTSWDWEPGDEGREYKQVLQILYPDGSPFMPRQEQRFVMQPNTKHQINTPVLGFPIGQWGTYTVRMQLEHNETVIFQPSPIRLELIRQQAPGAAAPAQPVQ